MSILIKGMKMPKSCAECPFFYLAYGAEPNCNVDAYGEGIKECYLPHMEEDPGKNRHPDCPLTELPPHGRLIDADALHKLFEDQWHYLQVLDWNENPTAEARQSGINWCVNTMHDDAPTIIPAEEGE